MVQIHLDPPIFAQPHDSGGLAQLGERLPCTQEVSGSTPLLSTTMYWVFLDKIFRQVTLAIIHGYLSDGFVNASLHRQRMLFNKLSNNLGNVI